ncbi:uncharacterized protein LOC117639914 [Thrips palmi]|uniref:Gustatory receptor n=1 Tax=Thrips palmi TaxID=161013 RepID=A0A6P8Y744_THRPL|nr:uncharacterized protein LOC117639914 [Thrips palmi]XP_034231851.1 uncharacterized protein LOC117639914 [Thrips palmi]
MMRVHAAPSGSSWTGVMQFAHGWPMDTACLRTARLLGLAPYVQTGSKLTQPGWLRWYSIGVTITSSLGAVLFLLLDGVVMIQSPAREYLSMAEVLVTLGYGFMAGGVILSRYFIIRRQYPHLQQVLLHPVVLGEAKRTPSKGALLVLYPDLARTIAFIVLVPIICAAMLLDAWYGVFSVLLAVEKVLESAELSLFLFLLDTLASDFKRLNGEITFLKQRKESQKDISEVVLQIRKAHLKTTECLEDVCECFGPQVSSVLFNMCALVVGLLAVSMTIAERMATYVNTSNRPFLIYAFFALTAGQVPIYIFSIIRSLNTADNVTAEGNRAMTVAHSLASVCRLTSKETEQVEIFTTQLSQRAAAVRLCRVVTLDLSLALSGLGSVANFFVLILQMREVKLESKSHETEVFSNSSRSP